MGEDDPFEKENPPWDHEKRRSWGVLLQKRNCPSIADGLSIAHKGETFFLVKVRKKLPLVKMGKPVTMKEEGPL